MANLSLKTYQWILRAAVEILDIFPPKKIEMEEIALRKGQYSPDNEVPAEGTIWVHGASLGEVITLRPFLRELVRIYGRNRILCTAMTMDGLRQLQKDEICGHASLLPIELPAFTIPFIEKMKPKVMLISETEIWPLLLATLKRKNIPYGIINGRINEKSVRMMRMLWPLFGTGVKNFSFAFPQEKQYERRFKVLGIENHKQKTLGCFKYDMPTSVESKEQLRKKYGIPPNRDLIVFGSTHPGEEDQILDALEPLWGDIGSTIVIAPRHLKRVPEIEQILKQRNLDFSRVSKKNATAGHIILVDTLGDLVNLYSLASLAFVGGSLIERGGHNLMEPAAFGVPILTGPHTFNFRYEMMALKRKRAVKVTKNSLELQNAIEDWLKNKESFEAMGCRAKELLQSMSGASHRTIESLQEAGLLPNGQSGNH